jgi:hypothetical protein
VAVSANHHLVGRLGGVDAEAELGGDDHLVAHRFQRLAEEDFVLVGAVDLCRIKQRDAEIDGAVQRIDRRRLVVGGTIGMAHAHAAEAEGGNVERAEMSVFHGAFPF